MKTSPLFERAKKNIQEFVTLAIGHQPDQPALLVFDEQSPLAKLLAEAYRLVLPDVKALNFDQVSPEEIFVEVNVLAPKNLVILVQSTSFRLNEFRFRIELFNRALKVIEHPHLSRIRAEEFSSYVEALAYDPAYYRSVGPRLKQRIDRARHIEVICDGTSLIYDTPFEEARLNIGDYSRMKNIGGQFPIGEVFTEPKAIDRVNGKINLFAFGNQDFSVYAVEEPFSALIENGVLVDAPDAPTAFKAVLEEIRFHEEKVWLRELGFGLNKAFTRENRVSDIGAYERMCGVHLSLGAKHSIYRKPGFPKKNRFHVDVFGAVDRVEIDGEIVYRQDRYTL
ncbi:MAG: hypothetical protein HY036_05600 [Nitrospirae bacterium]|nr:hypothetical protein [Nitrospirota bacterium]MBI3352035.1 hypothetical protein [Nitrospirota bacterium]